MLFTIHTAVLAIGLPSICQRVFAIKQVSCRNQPSLKVLGACMRKRTPRPLALKCLSELQDNSEHDSIGLNLRNDRVSELITNAENRALSNEPFESDTPADRNEMCENTGSDLFERIAEDIKRQEFEEAQRDRENQVGQIPTEISIFERSIHDALQLYLVFVIIAYAAAGFFAVYQYVQHVNLNFYFLDVACVAAVSHVMVTKGIITSDAYKRLNTFRKLKDLKPNEYLVKTLQIEEEKEK